MPNRKIKGHDASEIHNENHCFLMKLYFPREHFQFSLYNNVYIIPPSMNKYKINNLKVRQSNFFSKISFQICPFSVDTVSINYII